MNAMNMTIAQAEGTITRSEAEIARLTRSAALGKCDPTAAVAMYRRTISACRARLAVRT